MARPNLGKLDPASYQALLKLSQTADASALEAGIAPLTIELVKIRTSQLNGCAFCLRMHTRDALAKGEDPDRIAVLPAFRESQYFSPAEIAALEIAESLALISQAPIQDPALDERQAAAIAWVATVMNTWNRVAVFSGYPVGPAS